MRVTIDDLAIELKRNVLECLHRSGTGTDIANVLRVSKQWNALGTPMLWTNIVIDNDNLLPFIRSLSCTRKHVGKLVRSLSVLLGPIPEDLQPFSTPLTRLGCPSDTLTEQSLGVELPDYLTPFNLIEKYRSPEYMSLGSMCLVVASNDLARLIGSHFHQLIMFSFRVCSLPTKHYRKNAVCG